jgi:hypothetical protein
VPVTPVSETKGPRTTVGLWLRALLLGDGQEYRRLIPMLNRGEKGWNDDEPAVVEAACQLMTQRFFSTYRHVSVEALVADMRNRIAKQQTPPTAEDMMAVIRAARNAGTNVPPHVRRGELQRIQGVVTCNISDILKLDKLAINLLVADSEDIAIARGFSPPPATEQ